MTTEEFEKAIEFEMEFNQYGHIVHKAKIQFHAQMTESVPFKSGYDSNESFIKERLVKDLYYHIYADKRKELGRAIDELLMYIEPKFFPQYDILVARDKILKLCGFEAGNRLIQDDERVW
jgi:hypothetical protein